MEELELKWLKKSAKSIKNSNLPTEKIFSNPDKKRFTELKTPNQTLKLDLKKGLTLREWSVNGSSLLGTIPHGSFEDISLAADYYSCHSVIEPQGEHKITDLENIEPWIDDNHDDFIYVGMQLKKPNYLFEKRYSINRNINEFSVEQTIETFDRSKSLIRSSHFTILPGLWDQSSFYYKTNLGEIYRNTSTLVTRLLTILKILIN